MRVQILKKTDFEISFLLEGVNPTFANSLRRVMIAEVPTMAIEWVDFIKNDSVLPDELLANRLAQIPLTFDMRAYNLPERCKCSGKGCSRCQVKLTLKKIGPCVVYSEDLKSRSKDIKPVFDKIPIVELIEKQELEFEAICQLGVGKEHVKWQAAIVGYKNAPKITIDSKKCKAENCEVCVEKCVKKILKLENISIVVTDPFECNMCLQCVDACPEEAIKVEAMKDSFIFNVESVSGLKAEEVVKESIEILKEEISDFSKSLKKLK